jgi:hypothetical protein
MITGWLVAEVRRSDRLRLVCSERMRRKLRFFDGCVMAVINLSASNMSM